MEEGSSDKRFEDKSKMRRCVMVPIVGGTKVGRRWVMHIVCMDVILVISCSGTTSCISCDMSPGLPYTERECSVSISAIASAATEALSLVHILDKENAQLRTNPSFFLSAAISQSHCGAMFADITIGPISTPSPPVT
jgi:hypothetical protein